MNNRTTLVPTDDLSDLQIAQEQCDEWERACRNLERINAEQRAEIERLRGNESSLRSVLLEAIQWDGEDDVGVPAVWREAAEEVLKETANA